MISDSYGLLEPTTRTSKAAQQPGADSDPRSFILTSSRPWSEIVLDYSSRHLSFGSDKLRALSVIAQVYHRDTRKEYLAGLWKQDLPLALCWFAVPKTSSSATTNENENPDSEAPAKTLQKRLADYRAPSWSWASIDDATFVYPAADERTIKVPRPVSSVKILKAEVTPGYAGGEFDSIISGCLEIEGKLIGVADSSSAARLVQDGPSSPGSLTKSGRIKVAVGERGHEVVAALNAAPEEEAGNDKYGSEKAGIWLLLMAEQVEEEEEEEEEEEDEGQHKYGNDTTTSPAYAGLVLKEVTQGQ